MYGEIEWLVDVINCVLTISFLHCDMVDFFVRRLAYAFRTAARSALVCHTYTYTPLHENL